MVRSLPMKVSHGTRKIDGMVSTNRGSHFECVSSARFPEPCTSVHPGMSASESRVPSSFVSATLFT